MFIEVKVNNFEKLRILFKILSKNVVLGFVYTAVLQSLTIAIVFELIYYTNGNF